MMNSEIRKLVQKLELSSQDEKKYNEIVNRRRQNTSLKEDDACYKIVLTSDKYSYEVKQKIVLTTPSLAQSRLWGLKNLAGHALYLFVSEWLSYHSKDVTLEEVKLLVANPAFDGTVDKSESNVPILVFTLACMYDIDEQPWKQILIDEIVYSPKMSLDLATEIMKISDVGFDGGISTMADLFLDSAFDATCALDWARKTYDLPESLPDSWVRQFILSGEL